jgi:hypothetical protein
MSKVFLLQNQHKFFINRQGLWVSGREPAGLYRVKNRDEAINEIFEISARDFDQRITIIETDATVKGVPIIDPSWLSELPEPVYGQDSNEVEAEDTSGAEVNEPSEPVACKESENAKKDDLALTLSSLETSHPNQTELDTAEKEGA